MRRFCSGSSTPASRSRNRSDASATLSAIPSCPAKTVSIRSRSPARSEPGVDEDAIQTVADRAMDQRRGDRGIDAARQSHQHAIVGCRRARESRRAWSRRTPPSSSRRARRKSYARSCAAPARRPAYARPRDGTGCPAAGHRECGPRHTANCRCARSLRARPVSPRRGRRDSSTRGTRGRRALRTMHRAGRSSARPDRTRACRHPRYARPDVARSRTSRSRFPAPGIRRRSTSGAMSGASVS